MKNKIIEKFNSLNEKIIKQRKRYKLNIFNKNVETRISEIITFVVIAALIGVFSGSYVTYKLFFDDDVTKQTLVTDKYIKEFTEAYDFINDNYYEDIDKSDLIDAAINGMTSTLDDYSSYMTPTETTSFNEVMSGSYKGIGIEFTTSNTGVQLITGIIENSPAAASKLLVGDIVLKVDDKDATLLKGSELATYIKGNPNEFVTLSIKRVNAIFPITIKKAIVILPSISSKIYENDNKKIGYIKLSIFADNTYSQFKTALDALEKQGITSLIIDVRNNSGGYLHSASSIMEMFLEKDKIIYQMQNKQSVAQFKDSTAESRKYPVVVLVNGASASASEILAAAFKESYGAKLIGTKTFGKGTVQQPNSMSNGGLIKITVNKWLTPEGTCVAGIGYDPTTIVELDANYNSDMIDTNDNQLQKAISDINK